jgi:hypothetical protein
MRTNMTDCIHRAFQLIFVLTLLTTFSAQLSAQNKYEFWTGANYERRIPSFRDVLGYGPGERITPHSGLMKYIEALESAAPNQVKVFEYAKSWEGRKLIYAVISSEENIRRIESIRAGMQKLADPRRTQISEARVLVQTLPAVVWLGYGVHGNEISSPDAALLTAYHLLASRNDPVVNEILSKTVVLIDPTQNPTGATASSTTLRSPKVSNQILARSPQSATSPGRADEPITTTST